MYVKETKENKKKKKKTYVGVWCLLFSNST